jgi:demethylspheroidene O-methyltransferase
LLYGDLQDPVALLRGERPGTQLASYWPYAGATRPAALAAEQVASYSALMSASQEMIAEEVLAAYPLREHRCLLDVGGGEGTFLAAAADHAPQLRLLLFDLPPVADRARARFVERGIASRAGAIGGDFHSDRLPIGADIVSLVRVLHDHDDSAVLALLRAVRRALPSHGTVLIAEPMSGTPGAEPIGDAYFGFYLLAMGRGRPRTPAEFRELLSEAGFGGFRFISTRLPLQASVIVANPER